MSQSRSATDRQTIIRWRAKSTSRQRSAGRGSVLTYVMIFCFLAWTIIPGLWILLTSLKSRDEVFEFNLWPSDPSFDAFQRVLQTPNFSGYLSNSVVLAVSATLLCLLFSIPAGYSFARFDYRWRNALLALVVLPRLIPQVSLITPLFELFRSVQLLNTRIALVLAYAALNVPFATWLYAGYISRLPMEIEEAAAVDGANFLQRMRRIVLPLSVPGLTMAATLTFVVSWNEFPFVLALTTSADMRTLPYSLYLLRDSLGLPDWPLENAFTMATVLPLIVIYLLTQKYVVSGITQGAGK